MANEEYEITVERRAGAFNADAVAVCEVFSKGGARVVGANVRIHPDYRGGWTISARRQNVGLYEFEYGAEAPPGVFPTLAAAVDAAREVVRRRADSRREDERAAAEKSARVKAELDAFFADGGEVRNG